MVTSSPKKCSGEFPVLQRRLLDCMAAAAVVALGWPKEIEYIGSMALDSDHRVWFVSFRRGGCFDVKVFWTSSSYFMKS